MKRKWIALIAGAAVLIAILGVYLVFINPPGDIDVEGRWELTSGPEGCYTEVYFKRGVTPKSGGAATREEEGNFVQMSFGTYDKVGDNLVLSLTNPVKPPFDMKLDRNGQELGLDYELDGKQLSCGYKLKE